MDLVSNAIEISSSEAEIQVQNNAMIEFVYYQLFF